MQVVLGIEIVLAALGGADEGLTAEHLYNGVGRPVPIVARAPAGADVIDLVLMDETGVVLAAPRSAPPGPLDLQEIMPAAMEIVRERERACWLQMLAGEEPIGPALVLQPMLSRMVPITQIAPHPVTGQPHTKIVGWEVEPDGPPAAPVPGAAPRSRTFTGLRIYSERDVLLETSLGDIVVALRPDEAPGTAWNFRELAAGGFYRSVAFHRIVPTTRDGDPFVIQGGDPGGSGEGGPGWWLPIEPSAIQHDFGVISMARADHPDSAGSQFFLCLSRRGTARLDGQYCAFGWAVAGAETIQAIAAVELADVARGRPAQPPVIIRAALVPAPPRRPGAGRPDGRVTVPAEAAPVRSPQVPR